MNQDDRRYQQWKARRADVQAPADFANQVMEAVWEEAAAQRRDPWYWQFRRRALSGSRRDKRAPRD